MSEKIILEILFILIAILTYAVLDNRNKNNTDCVGLAYKEIKDRKGKMANGVFAKEQDLKR